MDRLTKYSTSDSEEEDQKPSSSACVKKLPNLLAKENRMSMEVDSHNNPDLHDGRKRSIKHERGNWASFIYILVPQTDIIEKVQQELTKFLNETTDLKIQNIDSCHISLTKLLILSHHWIGTFVEKITSQVEDRKSFNILLNEIEVYCNEDKTRTFIGIKSDDNKGLSELTALLDECLKAYKLPKFYEDPSIHTSILWTLGDKTAKLNSLKNELQTIFDKVIETEDEYLYFTVKELLCKCGNRLYKFPLR